MDLNQSVIYDIEVLPNVFTLDAELLNGEVFSTWEISPWRDDRLQLMQWFNFLQQNQIPMFGFNVLEYDYIIIHFIMTNPNCTNEQIYAKSQEVIKSKSKFSFMIWPNKRFAPQIDLRKIHHFENKAKMTSLKALQVNMRSENVVDILGHKIAYDKPISEHDLRTELIPYGRHDVKETKKFTHISEAAIKQRLNLLTTLQGDVMNFNDTKIGGALLEQRLGNELCYVYRNGKREKRQTPRNQIALRDVIFPYIKFTNPEFHRIHMWMMEQTLLPKDIEDPESDLKTKGVFDGVEAYVGGIKFKFGTGGIHASVEKQFIQSTEDYIIRDIDVKSLYPSIAIVNRLAPEHLGQRFVEEYAKLPVERAKYDKKTAENASFKLASNGTYGNSNNKFSVFFDPKFTMTITINGQLMLCMLAELLLQVPTLKIIQVNTDGITYIVHKDQEPLAKQLCQQWEQYTCLVLEDADYSRMWIRDVNNYIAEKKTAPGSNKIELKQKGAYWHPDPDDYENSITFAGPPAWHKDFNPVVVTKAAVQAMVHGIPPEIYIPLQTDKFDFMLRCKIDRKSKLYHGSTHVQSTGRYYVSREGEQLRKISPPPEGYEIGQFKRRNGIDDNLYSCVMKEIGQNVWDERIHTKNKSKYEMRETQFQSGWKTSICNDASDFDFNNVNYDWYIAEARKLIIS